METMQIGSWNVAYDREKTESLHNAAECGASGKCQCCHCRNFVAARDMVYPEIVRRIMASLGVDYKKEQELYEICEVEDGWHLYNGWFRFVGAASFPDGELDTSQRSAFSTDEVTVNDNFSWSLSQQPRVVWWGLPIVEIHFQAKVPWVLGAEEDEL